MRKLSLSAVLFLCFITHVWAGLLFPNLTGNVVDEARVLNQETREKLTDLSNRLEKKTGIQFITVIPRSLQSASIEEYGVQLGRHWKIGSQDKNTGIILIIAPTEKQARIEVGYGLEGQMTDAKSSQVLHQEILPKLQSGNIQKAILAGANAITMELGNIFLSDEKIDQSKQSKSKNIPRTAWIILGTTALIIFIIFISIIFYADYETRQPGYGMFGVKLGRYYGLRVCWAIIKILAFIIFRLALFTLASSTNSSSSRNTGGGGSFGGGGASGRW